MMKKIVMSLPVKWKCDSFLAFVIVLQFVTFAVVFLDVPWARQVIVFAYLTFVPGMVIVRLLGLNELEGSEKAVFSVGFGVAFLMLIGLLVNEILFPMGILEPLSSTPIMLISSTFILAGATLACLRGGEAKQWNFQISGSVLQVMLWMCLPFLSVIGTLFVNLYGDNVVLLFMLLAISFLFAAGVASKKLLPPKLYPFALLMIGISLLLHYSLISAYVTGSDIHLEYYVLGITKQNAHWSSTIPYFSDVGYGRLNSMLSVTILPTIYSNLLNMDPTWVLKILFPVIFAFVALGLYQIWQTYVGKKYAFISAFLLMAEATFYTEMLQLGRQMVGELFFVLMLLAALNTKIKPVTKTVILMIFGFALIVSHYALAEILLFFVLSTMIILIALKRPSRNITATIVTFFCVVMFLWYVYTANSSVFDSFVSFGSNIFHQLGEFFNPASRGQTVLRGLGLETSPSILNTISRIFAYLTEALIVAGFIGLITKRTSIRLQKEHFFLTITAVFLLVALLLVPGLANTLNISRFYHILLFFLAPLCVIGAQTIVYNITEKQMEAKASILLLAILIPYFLFQTGFVYEVAKTQSYSVPLSSYRMGLLSYTYGIPSGYDVTSAEWLSTKIGQNGAHIYADITSLLNTLTSYGMIYRGEMASLSNFTQITPFGLVYLSHVNVIDNLVVREDTWNTTNILDIDKLNVVYTNAVSEIMQESP